MSKNRETAAQGNFEIVDKLHVNSVWGVTQCGCLILISFEEIIYVGA